MTYHITSLAHISALLALALPANADISPEELWNNWQQISAASGQTMIAASTQRQGDDLVISNITIASAAKGATLEGHLDQIIMSDMGDGTVRVTSSPDFPMKMRIDGKTDGTGPARDITLDILLSFPDMIHTASGSVDNISYAISAPQMQIKLARLDGPLGPDDSLTVDANLTNLSGTYTMSASDQGLATDSDITIAGLAMAMVGANKARGFETRLTAAMDGLGVKTNGTVLPAPGSPAPSSDQLANMNSAADITYASSTFDLATVDQNGPSSLRGDTGAGTVQTKLQNGIITYNFAQSAVNTAYSGVSLPVPQLSFTLDAANLGMSLPLVPSEQAQPFGFSISLQNLNLSDQIWGMIDPSGKVPRDPIQLQIDTDGMARTSAGMTPETALNGLGSLNLKHLRLALAGAALQGKGSSTFSTNPAGQVQPNGKLDFTLDGANALMDNLVAAGLLTPEMLTFPRMMLAMVARPVGDGGDSFASQIELREGSVYANGQMLYQLP